MLESWANFKLATYYITMLSIDGISDCARRQIATQGRQLLDRTISLAKRFRREANEIEGIYCFG